MRVHRLGWMGLIVTIALIQVASALNLVPNPGFEQGEPGKAPAVWACTPRSGAITITDEVARSGKHSLCMEYSGTKKEHLSVRGYARAEEPGAYLARCWVKVDGKKDARVAIELAGKQVSYWDHLKGEQTVRPGDWQQIQIYAWLPQAVFKNQESLNLPLTIVLCGQKRRIWIDDVEVVRIDRGAQRTCALWDAGDVPLPLDMGRCKTWKSVALGVPHFFAGTPVLQAGQLVAVLDKATGGWHMYSLANRTATPRGLLLPDRPFQVTEVRAEPNNERTAIRLYADGHAYTLLLVPPGILGVEKGKHVNRITFGNSRIRYGILPSFLGADLLYDARKYGRQQGGQSVICLPSLQWFVGLLDDGDAMLTAVWESREQAVTLVGKQEAYQRITIDLREGNAFFSLAEAPGIWHVEPNKEEWLERHVPIDWQRPFEGKWVAHLPVQGSDFDYAFHFMYGRLKTWGGAIEGHHYLPAYFDADRTMLHFEKNFPPVGETLIYFLEPAAAAVLSPAEVLTSALGAEEAGRIMSIGSRKIVQYGRPVCGTCDTLRRLAEAAEAAKKEKDVAKFADHVGDFIRDIREHVTRYAEFLAQTRVFLAQQKAETPALGSMVDRLIGEIQAAEETHEQKKAVYNLPMADVRELIEQAKSILTDEKEDSLKRFMPLDKRFRQIAGTQDYLCRFFSQRVIKLTQIAAEEGARSPEAARLAQTFIQRCHNARTRPTGWEARRGYNR